MDIHPQAHFHIRWDSGRLDWEPFNSGDEAERRAKELVRPTESYRIERFDNTCQFCKEWLAKLWREKPSAS